MAMAVFVPRMPAFRERGCCFQAILNWLGTKISIKPSLATHSYCEGTIASHILQLNNHVPDQEGTGGNLQNLAMNHVDVFLFSYFPAFPPENSGFWHVQLPKKTGGSHDRFGQEQMEEMKERLDELKEMKDMMRLAKNHWCPVMINLSDYTPVNLVN